MDKLGNLKHLFVTVFLSSFSLFVVIPAITDVTLAALCPGEDECSLAIYLSGFQQVVIGIGSVVITPLIGNLSDVYGKKALLTIPLTVAILPLVVLAYSRAKVFFYTYYVLKTVAAMVCEGTISCLSLAYVADNICETKRATAFGILSGIGSTAFVCGTVAARFLSTGQTFQAAACSAMAAAVYMRIFVKETTRNEKEDPTKEGLLLKDGEPSPGSSNGTTDHTVVTKIQAFKIIPSIEDIKSLLQTSKTFSQVAVIAFFNSLAEGGLQASLLYYLKARFHFSKNQYADLLLIVGIAGMVSQLLLMPILAPILGEEKLLCIGLFVTTTNIILNSIAWSFWIPYIIAGFAAFIIFTNPCMRSIASKQVGPGEQGKAQGCISGISAFANIISPLIFSPLTALFLSDGAPFAFPGFSLLCIGLTAVIAFIQSLGIRSTSPCQKGKANASCTPAHPAHQSV